MGKIEELKNVIKKNDNVEIIGARKSILVKILNFEGMKFISELETDVPTTWKVFRQNELVDLSKRDDFNKVVNRDGSVLGAELRYRKDGILAKPIIELESDGNMTCHFFNENADEPSHSMSCEEGDFDDVGLEIEEVAERLSL